MSGELLEIQPQELKFIFELKKQSTCSVRLFNKSNNYVGFKVKTTSPKKYSVRPNTGIIEPNSARDFIVTMQAQRVAPPEMISRDKFLIQSIVVPMGTKDEEITSSMFSKDESRYVEENKLRVILVSPPHSPVLSPINGVNNEVPAYDASKLQDQVLHRVEDVTPQHKVIEDLESKVENHNHSLAATDSDLETLNTVEEQKVTKDVESRVENHNGLVAAKGLYLETVNNVEELDMVKDIENMKSKISELESKLNEAEVTISKLTDERRSTIQERENLQQELALLRSKKGMRKLRAGFPSLFVCMVALLSVILGYILHC